MNEQNHQHGSSNHKIVLTLITAITNENYVYFELGVGSDLWLFCLQLIKSIFQLEAF